MAAIRNQSKRKIRCVASNSKDLIFPKYPAPLPTPNWSPGCRITHRHDAQGNEPKIPLINDGNKKIEKSSLGKFSKIIHSAPSSIFGRQLMPSKQSGKKQLTRKLIGLIQITWTLFIPFFCVLCAFEFVFRLPQQRKVEKWTAARTHTHTRRKKNGKW